MARPQKKPPSKLCIRCNKVLPLGDFYPNKEWVAQSYRDAWCKECVAKHCTDEETIKQYCSLNNRKFNASCWECAVSKAKSAVANNADYVSPKTTPAKREIILLQVACKQFFSLMNLVPYYTYVDNIDENGMYLGDVVKDEEDKPVDNRPVYSKVWRGTYTPEQIEMLDEQYAKLKEDFDLDDENRRDYARKVVRASFNADMAEDKYRRGELTLKEYRDAANLFDTLSKSSEFAACKKKPGEAIGVSALSLIVQTVEQSGA